MSTFVLGYSLYTYSSDFLHKLCYEFTQYLQGETLYVQLHTSQEQN